MHIVSQRQFCACKYLQPTAYYSCTWRRVPSITKSTFKACLTQIQNFYTGKVILAECLSTRSPCWWYVLQHLKGHPAYLHAANISPLCRVYMESRGDKGLHYSNPGTLGIGIVRLPHTHVMAFCRFDTQMIIDSQQHHLVGHPPPSQISFCHPYYISSCLL